MFMIDVGWGIYLGVLSFWDIRFRRIPAASLMAGIAAAAVLQILGNLQLLPDKILYGSGIFCCDMWQLSFGGAAVGLLFLLVSKITKESLGYGDSLLILSMGIYMGLWNLLDLLCIAFFLAAVFAIILLGIKKMRKKSAFAFMPFIEVAYLVVLLRELLM